MQLNLKINFELLCDQIMNERTVLLIGPEFNRASQSETLKDKLLKKLDLQNNLLIKEYRQEDELFVFDELTHKIVVTDKIINFYKEQKTSKLHEKITQIPFNLILSTNPDLLLRNAFQEEGIEVNFDFYYHKEKPKEIEIAPSIELPFIYNLFGSIQKDDSLILTHADLFDYIFAILGKHRIPTQIRTSLQNARSIIFLGFQFDKWYVQMLLKLLDVNREKLSPYASSFSRNEAIELFLNKEYKIEFIDNNIEEFIDGLLDEATKLGINRKKGKYISPSVIKFIENNKLYEALKIMEKHFTTVKDDHNLKDIKLLQHNYNMYMQKVINNAIPDNIQRMLNNLKLAMLLKVEEIKKMENI